MPLFVACAIYAMGINPARAEVTTFTDDFSSSTTTEAEWVQGITPTAVGVDDAIWEATGGGSGVYRADTSTPPAWPLFSATSANRLGCGALQGGEFPGVTLYRKSDDMVMSFRIRYAEPPPLETTGAFLAGGYVLSDRTHPSLFPSIPTGLLRLDDGLPPNRFWLSQYKGFLLAPNILEGGVLMDSVSLPNDFDFTQWHTIELSVNGSTVTSRLTGADGSDYTIAGEIPPILSPDGSTTELLQGAAGIFTGPGNQIVEFDDFSFTGDELCIDNTPAGTDVEAALYQNVTITFDEVTTEGATIMVRDDDPPPAAPTSSSFSILGEYYDITTTAEFTGDFTLVIPYDDSGMTLEEELALAVLHFNETTMLWEDVTVRPVDTVNDLIEAQGSSLSVFVVAAPSRQITFLKPIGDGTVVELPAGPYKLGRTIPVKFRVLDDVGQIISNEDALALDATIRVFAVAVGGEGVPVDPGDNPPDLGDSFRYDADDFQFIFNLGTKNAGWTPDTIYRLEVLLDGIKSGEAFFALR